MREFAVEFIRAPHRAGGRQRRDGNPLLHADPKGPYSNELSFHLRKEMCGDQQDQREEAKRKGSRKPDRCLREK
jgi:hypothetical protein